MEILRTEFWSGYGRNIKTGKCSCGKEVDLTSNTNECECGKLYNYFGQELCDPRFWGEETGESPQDCW